MLGTITDALVARYGWRRGLRLAWQYRKANRLPKGTLVRFDIPELSFPVHLRSRTTDISVLKQVLLQGNLEFPLASSPSFIVDAGANVGLVSALLASRFPNARIVAIELERSNVSLLRKNVESASNVTVLHAALWGRSTQLVVQNPEADPWGFRAGEVLDTQPFGGERIHALTVDDVMRQCGHTHIDLLKVDIEGGEREVFADSSSAWIDRVAVVAIEIHEEAAPGSLSAVERALPPSQFSRSRHGEYDVFTRR
jgi:FkbM family methyltransferase